MHRILVIANETCPCPALLEELAARAEKHGEHTVQLVAPALNSRLRHLLSDSDDALDAAKGRLEEALGILREAGVTAEGEVGDGDPHTALGDALAVFEAHEIIISTYPPADSHWLENGIVEKAEAEFDLPVTHVVSEYGAPGRA